MLNCNMLDLLDTISRTSANFRQQVHDAFAELVSLGDIKRRWRSAIRPVQYSICRYYPAWRPCFRVIHDKHERIQSRFSVLSCQFSYALCCCVSLAWHAAAVFLFTPTGFFVFCYNWLPTVGQHAWYTVGKFGYMLWHWLCFRHITVLRGFLYHFGQQVSDGHAYCEPGHY